MWQTFTTSVSTKRSWWLSTNKKKPITPKVVGFFYAHISTYHTIWFKGISFNSDGLLYCFGITYHSSNKQAHSEGFLGVYGRGYPPPYVTPAPVPHFLTHMGGNSSLNKISGKNFVVCVGGPLKIKFREKILWSVEGGRFIFSLVGVPEKNSGKNFHYIL